MPAASLAVILLSVFFMLSGCGSSREKELAQGVAMVKAIIEDAGKNPGAALALQSAQETGGTIVNYVAVNLPPGGSPLKTLKLALNRPTQPWTIVIRYGNGPRDYIIEGYGEGLDKPLYVETFTIGTVSAPK